jgi:hypothetical protein
MIINNKFNIGDEVKIEMDTPITEICKCCGTVKTTSIVKKPHIATVEEIYFNVSKQSIKFNYRVKFKSTHANFGFHEHFCSEEDLEEVG